MYEEMHVATHNNNAADAAQSPGPITSVKPKPAAKPKRANQTVKKVHALASSWNIDEFNAFIGEAAERVS